MYWRCGTWLAERVDSTVEEVFRLGVAAVGGQNLPCKRGRPRATPLLMADTARSSNSSIDALLSPGLTESLN